MRSPIRRTDIPQRVNFTDPVVAEPRGEFPDLLADAGDPRRNLTVRIFNLKNNNKKRVAVIAILVIAVSVIGVAIAAWTTGG